MYLRLSLVCLIAISCVGAEKFRFDNYTLYNIYPKNVEQVKLLQNLQDSNLRYDFWSDPMPSAELVTVMSPPEDKSNLETFLRENNFEVKVSMKNVQEAIDKETVKRYTRSNFRSMTWDAYYTLDDIYAWLDDLVAAYPSLVTPLVGGISYEDREIKGIRISHGSGRRAIFLEGGMHSREWISPATVTYITNELLTSSDAEIAAVAREFDWYIFPVANPDGYVWSHDSFRMWRKNRRPVSSTAFGVDLNRNWNANWLVAGASTNPASDSYAGLGPFSEPETRTFSTYIRSIGDQIDLYLSFHSFSQLLLIPFGNSTEPYANYHDALSIGRRAMGALSVRYDTRYTTGNIGEAIYLATGGSIDWIKEQLQVPLVYCYELRDLGQFGFLLPAEQIMPNNLETMDSLLEMIHQAQRHGYMNDATALKAPMLVLVTIFALFGLM